MLIIVFLLHLTVGKNRRLCETCKCFRKKARFGKPECFTIRSSGDADPGDFQRDLCFWNTLKTVVIIVCPCETSSNWLFFRTRLNANHSTWSSFACKQPFRSPYRVTLSSDFISTSIWLSSTAGSRCGWIEGDHFWAHHRHGLLERTS